MRSAHRTDLCFSICRSPQVVFIPRAQPHAPSLFLFPIVFGINLIHFLDEKDGAAGNSIVCFGDSIPCHTIWQKQNEEGELFRRVQRFWQRKGWMNSAPFKRGETKVQIFGKEKCKIFRQHYGANFWQGKVQNSSPISALLRWRHFRLTLSLSLSLCISLSHRAHLTHNIGSASALPIMLGKDAIMAI